MTTICHQEIQSSLPGRKKHSQTFFSILAGVLNRVAGNVKQGHALRKQRRIDRQAFAHLLKLNDYILSDIGITRDDVIWASRLPKSTNASIELEKIARMNKKL